MHHPPATLLFALIAELAMKCKATSINLLPACWEHQVDGDWRISINGHDAPTNDASLMVVPPYTAACYFANDFMGFVDPAGGCLLYGAEDKLIAAIRAALDAEQSQ